MAPTPPFGLILATFSSDLTHPFSAHTEKRALVARAVRNSPHYKPGGAAVDPFAINNNAIFALFGLLGAGLVLTSIWFFFWARNGGFRWRKGDWAEYKSTVLRRKGPNGTTLSGATKSTDLGGGSVVGSQGSFSEFADPEKGGARQSASKKGKQKRTQKSQRDDDMRAYRQEKVARVGGLNRAADGAYYDNDSSNMSSAAGTTPSHKPAGRPTIKPVKVSNPIGRQLSFNAGTESGLSAASDDSHRPLNASRQQHRHPQGADRQSGQSKRASGTANRPRHSSHQGSMPGSFADPLDLDSRYDGSDLGSEQARHSKAYFHPLPSLSSNAAGPSRGFRRG